MRLLNGKDIMNKPITNKIKFSVKKNGNYTEQMYCAIEAIKIAFQHANFKPDVQYEMKLRLQEDAMDAGDDDK